MCEKLTKKKQRKRKKVLTIKIDILILFVFAKIFSICAYFAKSIHNIIEIIVYICQTYTLAVYKKLFQNR